MPDQHSDNLSSTPKPDSPAESAGNTSSRANSKKQRPASKQKHSRPRRIIFRTIAVLALMIPLIAIVAFRVLANAPMLERLLREQAEQRLGCEFHAQSVRIDWLGRLVITEPRVVIPGVRGNAAEVLAAPLAVVHLDWSSVLNSAPRPTLVRIDEAVIRVSQETNSGIINLALLGPPDAQDTLTTTPRPPTQPPDPSAPTKRQRTTIIPPRIDLRSATLELGEHNDAGSYTTLASLTVRGLLAPEPDTPERFTVKLQRIPDALSEHAARQSTDAPGDPFAYLADHRLTILAGELDVVASTARLELLNVDLAEWGPDQTPSSVRELWTQLDVRGSIPRSEFRYTPGTGVIVTVTLADVTMNTPVQADTPDTIERQQSYDYLSLGNVSGTLAFSREGLDARLQGLVEDLPCQVNLQTVGLSVNAPLRCEIISERFVVGDEPELMPYVPRLVRRRFADFSGPTATVDARVLLTRGEPIDNQPAELTTEGTIRFENGRAAFENFAYPVIELAGLVRFTDESIDVVSAQGRGPRGGIVSGQAKIAPLTTASRVNVEVLALDIPVDDILRDAIPGGRGRILDQLLSQSQYNKLIELGLVRPITSPTQHASPQHQATNPSAEAPPFNFGGVIGQLEIVVKREPINDGEWSWSADVDLPRLGLVPEGFPLPIEATDVRLELGDTHARLIGGNFRGAGGGNANIAVDVVIGDESNNNAFDATITVVSDDMPIDARLIHALPDTKRAIARTTDPSDKDHAADAETHDGAEDDDNRLSIRRLLTQLRPTGTMGVNAAVYLHDEPGHDSVRFDVTADLANISARPLGPAEVAGLHIDNITGRVNADNQHLRINNLRGTLLKGENDHIANLTLDAVLRGTTDQQPIPGDIQPDTRIDLLATDLRIEAPFEHLLAIFSERAADAVASIRARHNIAGLVNADVRARSAAISTTTNESTSNPDENIAVSVELSELRQLRLYAYDTDLAIPTTLGRVRIAQSPISPGTILGFDNFSGSIHPAGETPIGLALNGSIRLTESENNITAQAGQLTTSLTNARFESPTLAKVLSALTTETKASKLLAFQPRGRFDADIDANLGPIEISSHSQTQQENQAKAVTIDIRPTDLAFTLDDQRHRFDRAQGRVLLEIDNASAVGLIESLRLQQPALTLAIDGPFQYTDQLGLELRTSIAIEAERYDNTTAAILPQPVRDALDSIDFKSNAAWSVSDAWIGYTARPATQSAQDGKPSSATPPAEPAPGVAFVGVVTFEHLLAEIGLPIDAHNVSATIDARRPPAGQRLDFSIDLHADRLAVAGVPMTTGRARVLTASAPGSIAIPQASADCEGGRVSMNALLRYDKPNTARAAANNPPSADTGTWTLNVQVAGARLVPVLDSIRATNAGRTITSAPGPASDRPFDQQQHQQASATADQPQRTHTPTPTADDRRRGYLDATLSLAGNVGNPEQRTGRGTVRVSGGDVVSLPVILNLVELTSLQLPVGDKLDYLDASFHVLGNTWSFDQISLVSDTMSILGSGTMTTPENNLDLRFAARSRLRLPVITDLVEGVRDELATVTVSGTADDPRFRVEQLSATRMFIDSIFGQSSRDNSQSTTTPSPDADRDSRSERDRLRGRR